MSETTQAAPSAGSNRLLPLVALVSVLAAWGAVVAGQERVSRPDLSQWGTDLDIPERLAIDGSRAQYFLPYIRAAVMLDPLTFVALCRASARGRLRVRAFVAVVWFAPAGWHGLSWAVTAFFAM